MRDDRIYDMPSYWPRKPSWSERHPILDEAARVALCMAVIFFAPFIAGLVL